MICFSKGKYNLGSYSEWVEDQATVQYERSFYPIIGGVSKIPQEQIFKN